MSGPEISDRLSYLSASYFNEYSLFIWISDFFPNLCAKDPIFKAKNGQRARWSNLGRRHPSLSILSLSPELEDTLHVSHRWHPKPQRICGHIRRGLRSGGSMIEGSYLGSQKYMCGVGMKAHDLV